MASHFINTFLNSYIATYLERDVRSFAQVGSLRDFERFLRACALRSANLLNKADLARDVGVAPSTINQWISIVEAAGQILLLEPWFTNQGKRLIKPRRPSSPGPATATPSRPGSRQSRPGTSDSGIGSSFIRR